MLHLRDSGFTLTAMYTDDSPVPEGFERLIGSFEVGPPAHPPPDGGKAKLKIKIKLNLHGVVILESVQQVEEEEYEETVKVYEPAPSKVRAPGSQ